MEQAQLYQNKLNKLETVIIGFGKALQVDLSNRPEDEVDLLKNGQVQKFEYSVELLWKTIRFFLFYIHGIECNSPKSCMKMFYQNTEMSEKDYEELIEMINSRNELSHVYDDSVFDKIFNRLNTYLDIMKSSMLILREN